MLPKLDLSLLIPTYNESDIIASTLEAVAKELGDDLASRTEVMLVDDGTDSLPAVILDIAPRLPFASVECMRNAPPLGKGKSLARGFAHARGPVVGFLDADLSTPASYIRQAYDVIRNDEADLFIGSRRVAGAEVTREQSAIKDVLGDVLHVVVNGFIFSGGRKYRDTQCGFKFFKNKVAKVLYKDLVAGDGMTDVEVLVRANMLKYRVKEVGVVWNDTRESKRSLRRILVGEVKAISAIVLHYKILGGEKLRKLKSFSTGGMT
ncbi:MAG: glycosyltransferase [Deltaproteobacteria bacterium]|nr:glycosyltransferase [Deltaproteobacteria bacterium]